MHRLPRRCLPGMVLLLSALSNADPASATNPTLENCRQLRLSAPADALPSCESAGQELRILGQPEGAFEAWMHAAELASQLGDSARAETALDEAVPLLADVSDPLAAHRLARRRGLNAYRDRRPVEALSRFLEALAAARASGNAAAIAISENDLGVTHRHLGNLPAALGHLEASLTLREARGDAELGALLANVGSLYLELGDLPAAERYLQRALDDHRDSGRELLAMRTSEELARLAERQGQTDAARETLQQAARYYADIRAPRDQLRVALRLAELDLDRGDAQAARRWLDEARALAAELDRSGLLQVEIVAARLAASDAERSAAYAALGAALDGASDAEPDQVVEAHATLARLAEALGRPVAAIEHLRNHQHRAAEIQQLRHGERLDALRVRFDVARLEADRDRLVAAAATQEAELARRRLETVLVAAAALLALALLALAYQARLYRIRLRTGSERAALERRVADARQAANLLRSDLRSMGWLLDQQQTSAVVFDAAGSIRAITDPAARLLGKSGAELQSAGLADAVGADAAQWAQSLVDAGSLAGAPPNVDLGAREHPAAGVSLRCRRLDLEEELGVLLLDAADGATPAQPRPVTESPKVPGDASGVDPQVRSETATDRPEDPRTQFRNKLVQLMQASVDAWERVTRKTRVHLAEASGIWRITVDDGRLRVRALDRYLRTDTLPERPRWREVLRTAYFVLAEVQLDPAQRSQIEALVDELLHLARDSD